MSHWPQPDRYRDGRAEIRRDEYRQIQDGIRQHENRKRKRKNGR